MTKSLILEEENIIKDIKHLFRLKKKLNYSGIKYIRNLFRLEKETNSIKDYDEKSVMHSKSDKIKIMINDEADEVIEKLFESLKNRYQNNLESMKGSEFVFDYVHLSHLNVIK